MTETPSPFADAPVCFPAPPGPDRLSDMLRAVRLTCAVFFSARLTAPFGLISPKRYDTRMPASHLRHVSVFHLVAEGDCLVETARGGQRPVVAGDLLLLPFADQHRFFKGAAPDMIFDPSVIRREANGGIWTVSHGGGGVETRIVCGFIESAEMLVAPIFRMLPELVVEHVGEGTVGARLASTVCEMLTLVDAATPGTQEILGRTMELLFVEVLRRHASRLPAGSRGVLAALGDPVVGRALQLVHSEPARRWTTDILAREVGTSRTVLGERFNVLLGKPPIEYLMGWRIQLAADKLRNANDGIARIASDVGYESEAAFSRAFKRVTGMTPGRWRDGDGDSPDVKSLRFEKPVIAGPS